MTRCVIYYTLFHPGKTIAMTLQIRPLRRQLGLSLQTLAEASGLTRSYLSKVERGLCVPSIAAALKIAAALGVDVARLFGGAAARAPVTVVRRADRLRLERPAADDASVLEALATGAGAKRMQPFIVEPPPAFARGPRFSGHAGEEFLFVLKGRIEIAFPDRTESLGPGDAVYFDAWVPHRLRSAGRIRASALVVIGAGEGVARAREKQRS